MLCSGAMLFTCTLVIRCPVSKEGVECETWAVGTNNKILGGPEQIRNILGKENQQEAQSNPGSRPWRTYSRGAPRRWPFKYVQSYDCIIAPMKEIAMSFIMIIPYPWVKFTMLIDVYFSQVKNKPWLPWLYIWPTFGYKSGDWWTCFDEKNRMQKISCQCPFKVKIELKSLKCGWHAWNLSQTPKKIWLTGN